MALVIFNFAFNSLAFFSISSSDTSYCLYKSALFPTKAIIYSSSPNTSFTRLYQKSTWLNDSFLSISKTIIIILLLLIKILFNERNLSCPGVSNNLNK